MPRRYFMVGVILLLLGLQLRVVNSFVLTAKASEFIETKIKSAGLKEDNGFGSTNSYDSLLYSSGPFPQKTVAPPRWIGFALLSVGGVLVIHGLTLGRRE
jgi:hypothetical protein